MAIVEKLNYARTNIDKLKELTQKTVLSEVVNDIEKNYGNGSSGGNDDTFWNIRTNGGTNGHGLFAYIPAEICNENFVNFIKKMDTSQIEDFSYMFYYSNFTELSLDEWDMSNASDMSYMFSSSKFKVIDLSNCNINNVLKMSFVFYSALYLLEVDLTNCDTRNLTAINFAFNNCPALTTIKGILNLIKTTNLSSAFGSSSGNAPKLLEEVKIKNLNANGLNLSYCEKLSYDSLIYLINNLVETTTSKTVSLGSVNLAKLTEEEKAIATEKNWTLS